MNRPVDASPYPLERSGSQKEWAALCGVMPNLYMDTPFADWPDLRALVQLDVFSPFDDAARVALYEDHGVGLVVVQHARSQVTGLPRAQLRHLLDRPIEPGPRLRLALRLVGVDRRALLVDLDQEALRRSVDELCRTPSDVHLLDGCQLKLEGDLLTDGPFEGAGADWAEHRRYLATWLSHPDWPDEDKPLLERVEALLLCDLRGDDRPWLGRLMDRFRWRGG